MGSITAASPALIRTASPLINVIIHAIHHSFITTNVVTTKASSPPTTQHSPLTTTLTY
jgi:hypothetical protein